MRRITIAAAVVWMSIGFFGTPSAFAETEVGLADLSRMAAAEGIVLLKNEHQVLPLKTDSKVSVFGRIQVDYFACGYGSGGDVKTPYIVNILDAMRRHPGITINEPLGNRYESWCEQYPPDNGSWGNWPLNHPEMPLSNELVEQAAEDSDIAVVILGRSAGEDREAKLEAGSYYLTELEKSMLEKVNTNFEHVVVLLNSGNIIDMGWVNQYDHIDALLYIWQGGMQGGTAVADVLSGDVSPSGKLTATIARQYNDYPTSGSSGGEKIFGGWNFSNYVEDIYVGYRYFETFVPQEVLYPFGYGIGYTDFNIKVDRIVKENGKISLDVSVKNTGSTYSGKEVVQVYYGAPQGRLGKAVKSLAAYAKTKTLAPGEHERLQIVFRVDDMASYDDSGATGAKSAYVLEAGEYPVYVGNSVRNAVPVGSHCEKQLRITQQLTEISAVAESSSFQRMKVSRDPKGAFTPVYEAVPTRTVSLASIIEKNLPAPIPTTADQGIKLIDVFNQEATLHNFVAQFSVEELAALSRGDFNMGSSLGAAGNAGVYGGVTASLRDKGIVSLTAADGPSGVRLTASASLLPIGTALACTWNDHLVEDLSRKMGHEMVLNDADVLLAPGMNIQRDPLGGRNFEYFSEDPLLTGQMGANVVRGLQSLGGAATPKHFGLNNQETRRNQMDSRCSERAIREIYSKGFEICVKTAKPHNIMMSYNRINGVYSHYNYDLGTGMLREEWGYQGVVITDWWMQPDQSPDNKNIYDNAYRIQAQVDVLMPGIGPGDGVKDRSLLNSYETGKGITLGELQRSAMNTLTYVMNAPAFRKEHGLETFGYQAPENHFSVNQTRTETPQLTSLELDGMDLVTFSPLIRDYYVYTPDVSKLPDCLARAPAGCRVTTIKPTAKNPVATFKVSNDQVQTLYRIYFSDDAGMEPSVKNPVRARIKNLQVNGKEIPEFYPGIYEYTAIVKNMKDVKITADAPEGITVEVIHHPGENSARVRAESPHHAMEYKLQLAECPDTDDFDEGLAACWSVNNKTENFSFIDGTVQLITQKGDFYNDHEDHPEGALKNYITQPAGGSWEAIAKVGFSALPTQCYQSIGVMVMQDTDNYLHLSYDYCNDKGDKIIAVCLSQERDGSNSDKARNRDAAKALRAAVQSSDEVTLAGALYFKVRKNDDEYQFYVSADNQNYIQIGDAVTAHYDKPQFVLCASNGSESGAEPLQVRYDYVHFEMLPESETKVTEIAHTGITQIEAEDYIYKTTAINTQACEDQGGGQSIGWVASGDYLLYGIHVEESGTYTISPRVASNAGSLTQLSYNVEVDGEVVASYVHGGTGGWQEWKSMEPKRITLEEGDHKLRMYFNTADVNVNYLAVSRSR